MSDTPDITELLTRWRAGSRDAESALMDAVYPVLRDIARARLRRSPRDVTWGATELANEAYTRLVGAEVEWKSRAHFFAVAARAMRNVLVDYAREQSAEKRGRDVPFVPLEFADNEGADHALDLRVDWLSVHAALEALEAVDAHSARIVELKFFSGLTLEEIADTVEMSRATVVRDWRFARAWLGERLGIGAPHGS